MLSTPSDSDSSTTFPKTDSTFSTDEHELTDMQPSSPNENSTPTPKGKGKAVGEGKETASAPASVRKREKRMKNYTPHESTALAMSWVYISNDPIVSTSRREEGSGGVLGIHPNG